MGASSGFIKIPALPLLRMVALVDGITISLENLHCLMQCFAALATPPANIALEMQGNSSFLDNQIKNPLCTL